MPQAKSNDERTPHSDTNPRSRVLSDRGKRNAEPKQPRSTTAEALAPTGPDTVRAAVT
jgi:hypothetical protein